MKTSIKRSLFYGLLVLGTVLAQANRAEATLPYSLSLTLGTPVTCAGNTNISGTWTTKAGDTLDTMDVYVSTDGGVTFAALTALPLASITGIGTTTGTYSYDINLDVGDKIYTQFTSTKGVVTKSATATK